MAMRVFGPHRHAAVSLSTMWSVLVPALSAPLLARDALTGWPEGQALRNRCAPYPPLDLESFLRAAQDAGYDSHEGTMAAQWVALMPDPLFHALLAFLHFGVIDGQIGQPGFTAHQLVQEHGFTVFAALCLVHRQMSDPAGVQTFVLRRLGDPIFAVTYQPDHALGGIAR